MSDITYPNKSTGDPVTADDMNEIKSATNSKVDKNGTKQLSDENFSTAFKNQLESITATFTIALKNTYDAYASAVSTLQGDVTAINNLVGDVGGDGDSALNKLREALVILQNFSEGADVAAMINARLLITDVSSILTGSSTTKAASERAVKDLKDLIDGIAATVTTNTTTIAGKADKVTYGAAITSDYTLQNTDANTFRLVDNASQVNITIPSSLPAGFYMELQQENTGLIHLVAGSGVTLKSNGKVYSAGLDSLVSIYVRSTGVVTIGGQLI